MIACSCRPLLPPGCVRCPCCQRLDLDRQIEALDRQIARDLTRRDRLIQRRAMLPVRLADRSGWPPGWPVVPRGPVFPDRCDPPWTVGAVLARVPPG